MGATVASRKEGEAVQGRIPTQMLKGVIAGCVLAVIARGETYGYEISQRLNGYGFGDVAEGTIYPVLLQLEKSGCITATYRASELGPKRKYYTITEQGLGELAGFRDEFGMLSVAVRNLFVVGDTGNGAMKPKQSKGAPS